MALKEKLRGKRILIVDDEIDVLDTLVDELSICKIDTASTFEEAKKFLLSTIYDIVILDIMGVRGFDLLKIANDRNMPALMLTAHALSEESIRNAAEKGAENTRDMVATHGRSKNLGERSRGHIDPGAKSTSLIFRAMADYFS